MYSTRPGTLGHAHALTGSIGLALAMGVGRFAFTPLLPMMQRDAGVSIAAGSWLASANYLGYLIGALAALLIRVDTRGAIRASLLVTAASTLAMGLTSAFPAWLALRAVAGIASAFLLVHVSAWALERVGSDPIRRAAVFSGVGTGICAVGTACLLFDEWGLSAEGGWIALGAASFFFSALVWRAYEAPRAVAARAHVAHERARGAWRLVAAYAATGFGYIIPATFLPIMAIGQGADSALLDLAWPALGAAACASTFIAAKVFRGPHTLRTWKWAQALMAVGVSLPALSPTSLALVVSGICVGGTFMVVTMAAMQAARELGGRDPRRLMAAITVAFASGQICGPLVVALLVRGENDLSVPLAFAAAALIAGVLVLPMKAAPPIGSLRKET